MRMGYMGTGIGNEDGSHGNEARSYGNETKSHAGTNLYPSIRPSQAKC